VSFVRNIQVPDELPIRVLQVMSTVSPSADISGFGPQQPRRFFGGPTAGVPAIPIFRELVATDTPFAAILSLPNVFGDVNTFPGIRVGRKTVTSNYSITAKDFEILVDASAGSITITQLNALGLGQMNRVKKIDSSTNPVTVVARPGDFINDGVSTVLGAPQKGVTFIDAAVNYWDSSETTSFTLPSNVAYTDAENVFTVVNQFNGTRFTPRTVTSNYIIQDTDFGLNGNAAGGPITLSLPPSFGVGQLYHVRKSDSSVNVVTVDADGSDLIDGSVSISLVEQYSDCLLYDEEPGSWTNIGASAGLALPLELVGMRITDDGYFQLWNPDQSKYFTLLIRGAVGAEYIDLVRPGEA
jgi:hypothetical protein